MPRSLRGKVLITGGTGSLGTAIIDKAEREGWSCRITVLARNETKMSALLSKYPAVRGEIGDVRDLDWLRTVLPGHDMVIHAAAIKQVPTAESNVREATLTNVSGSQNVAMASVEAGIKRVIGISTDKACQPCTIYGCTKYLMEGLFREADGWSNTTKFILVRYGNVVRSNASVVPLFERQMRENIPFTVTDAGMTRFWISMPEAIDLILTAAEWDRTGVVLVPRLWSLPMYRVCEYLDPLREIVTIGARPGEKKHEQLINVSEGLHTKRYGNVFEIRSPREMVETPCEEYTSDTAQELSKNGFYEMLDSYNPNNERVWLPFG